MGHNSHGPKMTESAKYDFFEVPTYNLKNWRLKFTDQILKKHDSFCLRSHHKKNQPLCFLHCKFHRRPKVTKVSIMLFLPYSTQFFQTYRLECFISVSIQNAFAWKAIEELKNKMNLFQRKTCRPKKPECASRIDF